MVVYRGLGFLTFAVPFLLWIAIVIIATAYHTGGPGSDGDFFASMSGAAALALSAALQWPFAKYRERVAPGVDHLAFIPAKYWTYLFLIAAVGVAGWAFITKV